MKQKFITFPDEYGLLNSVAIIHYTHDDDNLTIEYLDWFEVELFMLRGCVPSVKKKDILSDKCEDIKLSECKGYKLHYTWHTVVGDYVRSNNMRKKYRDKLEREENWRELCSLLNFKFPEERKDNEAEA